ncbi:MAG: hypothetical protein GDA36_08385 [Rhodobacteraceae bacterium]|nr:hypothetical protein [Paracoccaceae bacterium]
MRTATRHQPLRAREQRGGRRICNRRFRVAHCLCHDDALPDSSGWIKQEARLATAAIGQNLPRKHWQSHNQVTKTALPKAIRPQGVAHHARVGGTAAPPAPVPGSGRNPLAGRGAGMSGTGRETVADWALHETCLVVSTHPEHQGAPQPQN